MKQGMSCSNCEQLCICIRWVDQHFDIHEDLIGLVQLHAWIEQMLIQFASNKGCFDLMYLASIAM